MSDKSIFELTHDHLKKMIKETSMNWKGYKKIYSECDHKPLKPIMEGEAVKHSFTIHCSDCGAPFWFAGTELRDRIAKLYE